MPIAPASQVKKFMTDIHLHDQEPINRLLAARPIWDANVRAATALNLDPAVILHAGPPFDSPGQIPTPVLNSAAVAVVFEQLADNFDAAKQMVRSGEVVLRPAQDYSTVVPLAGVVSPSMWLHRISDPQQPGNITYTPFNGGNGPAIRLGRCDEPTLRHLQWINTELIEALAECNFHGVNLLELASDALHHGDDCHGRTISATAALLKRFDSTLKKFPESQKFLADGPSFALNLLMAMAKCMLQAADNFPNSSVATAAGGNGVKMGLKVSGKPDQWFTETATPPDGDLGHHPLSRALGAIGDSAVVDLVGFGAMGLSFAPVQRKAFRPLLPSEACFLPFVVFSCVHDVFDTLDFRTGMCARTVVETQSPPIVSLGIIDRDGDAGRLGGGIYRYPLNLFAQSLNALAA